MSIILDFDGTITEKDTIGVLANYFVGLNPEKQEPWAHAVKQYRQDLQSFNKTYRPAEDGRVSSQDELNYMRAQRRVEADSIERVGRTGLFNRAEPDHTPQNQSDDMYFLGQRVVHEGVVKIRAGFKEFLASMLATEWKLGVLSLNWSTDFVKGILSTVDTRAPHDIQYCTNNISFRDGKIFGPTLAHEAMLTGEDKVSCWARTHPELFLANAIFIGDGAMDLACMMIARQAVVIARDPPSSYPYCALERIGNRVPHVSAVSPGWQFCHTEDFYTLTAILKDEPKRTL